MTSRLSTSSSNSGVAEVQTPLGDEAARIFLAHAPAMPWIESPIEPNNDPYSREESRSKRGSRWWSLRRLPGGGLLAVIIVFIVHAVVSCLVLPHPVARPELRRKIMALTEQDRPSLIIAGDSRAAWHLDPAVFAEELGRPVGDIVNIAVDNCSSTAVVAAYREFAHRFASNPILLLSVSLWSVNDKSPTYVENDELLWTLPFHERFSLVSPTQAFLATFSAERALWQRVWNREDAAAWPRDQAGFAAPAGLGEGNFSAAALERQARLLEREWYAGHSINGIRRQALESDLEQLVQWNVRVVLIDSPMHPRWLKQIEGTSCGDLDAQFHRALAQCAKKSGIPLIQYGEDWLGDASADSLYYDYAHLNREGARRFSKRAAADLSALRLP